MSQIPNQFFAVAMNTLAQDQDRRAREQAARTQAEQFAQRQALDLRQQDFAEQLAIQNEQRQIAAAQQKMAEFQREDAERAARAEADRRVSDWVFRSQGQPIATEQAGPTQGDSPFPVVRYQEIPEDVRAAAVNASPGWAALLRDYGGNIARIRQQVDADVRAVELGRQSGTLSMMKPAIDRLMALGYPFRADEVYRAKREEIEATENERKDSLLTLAGVFPQTELYQQFIGQPLAVVEQFAARRVRDAEQAAVTADSAQRVARVRAGQGTDEDFVVLRERGVLTQSGTEQLSGMTGAPDEAAIRRLQQAEFDNFSKVAKQYEDRAAFLQRQIVDATEPENHPRVVAMIEERNRAEATAQQFRNQAQAALEVEQASPSTPATPAAASTPRRSDPLKPVEELTQEDIDAILSDTTHPHHHVVAEMMRQAGLQ